MLNTTTNGSYSSQQTSGRRRILVTHNGDTRTVVTLDDGIATAVTAHLNELSRERRVTLHQYGTANTGQVCTLRRCAIRTVLNGPRPTSPTFVDPLANKVAGVSEAEKRAVADEVGRIFAGTDDVIVPVTLEGEYGQATFYCVANDWLTDVLESPTDEVLLDLASPWDTDSGPLYEGLLAQLRTQDDDIDAACSTEWIDVNIDATALIAWVRRNRPHLNSQIDELLAND